MDQAFICDAIRTPFGRYGGALSSVRTDDLGAIPLKALMARNAGVDWAALGDVLYGCANQAGEDNRNVARMALLLAGLPVEVPGATLNRLCGSGLDAVGSAARAIRCGEAQLMIAGGVESMSRAPFVMPKSETAFGRSNAVHDTTLGWRFVNPRMKEWHGVDSMPETAENVATQFKIEREAQDRMALRSQLNAVKAQQAGHLAAEITPVRTAFAWMTDFVGWLPMPEGGEREAFLTADYNLEMIEHVERFPRIRDRAIFVGGPDDIVPDDFGPGLPSIRDWTERHFAFSGYVTGFDPTPLVERREELRQELGYHPDERVVIVTVGGSGVGEALLRRVIASYTDAARRVNGLRMIAIAGPRIDPAILGSPAGVEVRAFVPDLYRHLAACDLAVVQGGLTTTMELAAARRPFLYFPLRNHFEQNRHVRHRLERYGAGRYMDYATSTPELIAEAIAAEIDRPVRSRPVETDGAARAAALIAPLI